MFVRESTLQLKLLNLSILLRATYVRAAAEAEAAAAAAVEANFLQKFCSSPASSSSSSSSFLVVLTMCTYIYSSVRE